MQASIILTHIPAPELSASLHFYYQIILADENVHSRAMDRISIFQERADLPGILPLRGSQHEGDAKLRVMVVRSYIL